MRTRIIAALLLAGCSASASATKSADQMAIEDLDAAYVRHIEATALPRSVATQAGFKEQLQQKIASLKELERAYLDFRESDEQLVAAHASKRLGQLYLNAGCEVATLELTAIDNPKVAPAAKQALEDTARPIFERAGAFFAEAAALRDGGEHATTAKSISEAMREPQIGQVCVATADHWEAPNRPEAAAPAVLGALQGSCDEAAMFGGRASPECFAEFKTKCDAGDAAACEQVGRHHHFAGATQASYDAFQKACELDGRCRPLSGFAMPSHKAEYAKKCDAGDGLGCLQLAQVVDEKREMLAMCGPTDVPDSKKAGARCKAGDPAGCWSQAGDLVAKKPVEFPTTKVGGVLGGLGMRGVKDETDEARRKRLLQECRQEMSWSCAALAGMLKDAGEDPAPTLRDACKHGRAGCQALATHLLELDNDEQTVVAVELLTKNCAADWSASCATAAKLFASGDGVPKSAACAAALSWSSCEPTSVWDCERINDVFGHTDK